MALLKRPYELSIWIEKLNENGSKDEIKGAVIGAHDMNFPGKAINIILKRELKGTNTLTFDMVDGYFDSLKGDYVENELINELFPERKVKLYFQDQWFEFFVKKISEKKILNNYIKSYTCTDAFIDELSRNGYGLTFDEELYNNVDEMGNFSEEVLDGSLWHYNPQYNWGDFSEFTEERLYKIPVSQFGGIVSGYRLNFNLSKRQTENLDIKTIKNIYTNEERDVEIYDDAARGIFWDQQNLDNPNGEKENPLAFNFIEKIENDGYIYVPYTCLNFCYGSEQGPDEKIKYDRAATETALKDDDNRYVISPQSVDPNTIIQFIAIPKNKKIEVDDQGVILNRDCHYFMTLRQWNEGLKSNLWYFFEDTRLVDAETLGSKDLMDASISHTFRYLYHAKNERVLDTYKETYGNKAVYYEGYLSDADENILLGRKYSVADRTEINISKDIDQYVVVYNNSPDEYMGLYSSSNWKYEEGDNKYRVCSKTETRQIIPQLARNFLQNSINMQSKDGWAPMRYLENYNNFSTGQVELKYSDEDNILKDTYLYYNPPHKDVAYIWTPKENNKEEDDIYQIEENFYTGEEENGKWTFTLKAGKNTDDYRKCRKNWEKKNSILDNSILSIYADENGKITWVIKENEKDDGILYPRSEQKPLENDDFNILNFGIVGQNKKIEKDKIYCIGASLLINAKEGEDNFSICIGTGSLISVGNYSFSNKIIEIKKEQLFGNQWLNNQNLNWNEVKNGTISPQQVKTSYILFRAPETIENPYFAINCRNEYLLKSVEFFEAYTKGQDSFKEDEAPFYRYSGRDLFGTEQPQGYENQPWKEREETGTSSYYSYSYSYPFGEEIKKRIIFEDMVMLGSTYEFQNYFIQRLKTLPNSNSGEQEQYYDTCGVKEFISSENLKEGILPLDAAKYTEDNYIIETNFINLNKCQYYDVKSAAKACDCKYGGKATKVCYYQKFGYCPYRFKTEKSNRRIRTLKISKSNRFNIIQEISKVFKVYPQFYIDHKANGHIETKDTFYEKNVFYITEKGMENKIGFRYERNLKDISRQFDSEKITTKMYVQDVDSELSKTGLCSIKAAEDNISKDSFIIDFSYYIEKGLLNRDEVQRDLYGEGYDKYSNSSINQGFLRQLGYYNEQYDEITNKIINLQDTSFTELEANLTVNLEGITTAQEQLIKIKQQMEHFININSGGEDSQAYLNYKVKKEEQEAILLQLISDTFYTEGSPELNEKYYNKAGIKEWNGNINPFNPVSWFSYYIEDYNKMKKSWVDAHLYTKGILGQFNKEYNQIQAWKKERASYLKMINKISEDFYKKYEPYLKEGTWSDSNYLTDNAYYFGALQTSAQGAIPKVSYSISVIGLDIFEEYGDIYNFYLADTTWIEDKGMFGINQKTGLPNKLKVLISEITYNLDQPAKDSIKVQNYTTKFEDLFQQVSVSVQSLQYNENIYKRSSNFTSLQNIETDSLQGTLDKNNLTLLSTSEENIQLDKEGTKGSDINNHANKYKQNGQGILFSNDGGQHWSVGIGPMGINADYIRVGTLDATKIRIVDGNYLYFSWDKDGIIAHRDPQGINTTGANAQDYACFNKYGLSLSRNGQIKLRAGYSFNGQDGSMKTEKDPSNDIGFYLYNNFGQEILAATSKDSQDSSQIRVFGELMITNKLLKDGEDPGLFKYENYRDIFTAEKGVMIKEGEWLYWKGDISFESCESLKFGNDLTSFLVIDGKIGYWEGYFNKKLPVQLWRLTKVDLNQVRYDELYILHTANDKNFSAGIFYYIGNSNPETMLIPGTCFGIGKEGTPNTPQIMSAPSKFYYPAGYDYVANYKVLEDELGFYSNDSYYQSYYYNGKQYLEQQDQDLNTSNEIACYINNKNVLNRPKGRMLSIVKKGEKQGDEVKNILSILNNGEVYVGGNILGQKNIYALSDEITIKGVPELTGLIKSFLGGQNAT